jgi:hypothetical protein
MVKEKKIDFHALLKSCFGNITKELEALEPDFRRVLSLKRVDLFPPDFGLSSTGKPTGGFYTFTNDPKKQQAFFSAMGHIFYQEQVSLIVKDFFPDACFVVLSFIRSPEGDILPENTRVAGMDIGHGIKLKEDNANQYKKLNGCLDREEIARVGINITTVSGGKVVGAHAMNMAIQPLVKGKEKTMLLTMLDPANLDLFKINLRVGEEIAHHLHRKPEVYIPTYGACRSSFQGNTDLCATWSMFLLLTHLVNPPSWWPRIENELLELSENEANKMIFQFAWWFRKVLGNVVYEVPGEKRRTYGEIIDGGRLFRSKLVPLRAMRVPNVEW